MHVSLNRIESIKKFCEKNQNNSLFSSPNFLNKIMGETKSLTPFLQQKIDERTLLCYFLQNRNRCKKVFRLTLVRLVILNFRISVKSLNINICTKKSSQLIELTQKPHIPFFLISWKTGRSLCISFCNKNRGDRSCLAVRNHRTLCMKKCY